MKLPKLTEPQRWGLVNGAFAIFVVLGPGFGINGATNIALFFAWLTFILTSVLLNDDLKEKFLENKDFEMSVPVWIDLTFDFCITAIFLWNSFWLTAIAYTIHTLILANFRKEYKKYWEQKENE